MRQRAHVQYLHHNFYIRIGAVNGISDQSVSVSLAVSVELRGGKDGIAVLIIDRNTALFIWRDTAGNDHANATGRALSIERRHAFESIGHFF